MKQILLRVPDELHRRLAARAERDGRSMNALANELLDLGSEVDTASRRDRLRARMAAAGLAAVSPEVTPPGDRDSALAIARGWGVQADRLIDEERDRL